MPIIYFKINNLSSCVLCISQMLVYEFMPNGSVGHLLSGKHFVLCDLGLDSSSCFLFPNILKKILWICMQEIILKPHFHFSFFPFILF